MAMKANTIAVMRENYITYAEVRGLPKFYIPVHYVGRNAILPLITFLSIRIGKMVGGSPLIENVFDTPVSAYIWVRLCPSAIFR